MKNKNMKNKNKQTTKQFLKFIDKTINNDNKLVTPMSESHYLYYKTLLSKTV